MPSEVSSSDKVSETVQRAGRADVVTGALLAAREQEQRALPPSRSQGCPGRATGDVVGVRVVEHVDGRDGAHEGLRARRCGRVHERPGQLEVRGGRERVAVQVGARRSIDGCGRGRHHQVAGVDAPPDAAAGAVAVNRRIFTKLTAQLKKVPSCFCRSNKT